MKRHFKIILIIAILFQIVVCFTGEIVFTTGNKIGNMPALGDIDYDEKYEFIIMKETGDLLILNPETLEKFKDYMISNFIKKGDILVNKKDDTIYAVKIPFDDTSTITPFIFDINEDGIEDIIMIFNKSGKIIGLDYYNLYKNYQKTGKDIIKNNYIIWSNQIENDEITSGVSLFKKHGKYYIVFGSKQEHLYIINLKTGVFVNNIDIHKFVSIPDRRMIRDSPLIYDINGDNFNDIIVGSNSGTIVALNGKTKTKLWTFSKKNSPVLFAPSVVKNNKTINLIVPFNEYKVVCLNAKTGREIWYYNTDASLFGAVTVADLNNDNTEEVLFVTVDGFLTCLNSLNGEKLWTFKTSKVVATPIVYDFNQDLFGDIVLCDNNGIIQIINSKTHLPMDNYKFITKGLQEIASQPLIGDFTGNGIIDIALNSTDKNFYMFTDREKIEIEQWKIINVTEKGDLYRTGNISENKINNAKLKFYLNNIRKKNFYKAANDYLSEGNINLAAFNFKKVLDIDPEYKDTAEQFGKIVDKFLNYEYKSFQEALNQENLATAKKILNDVEKVSASYEKLDEMRTLLGKKLKDHKEARRLLEDGKKDIAAHLMIVGYKKLQQAKKLAPKNNLINAEIQKYIYEMNLYNEMLQDISDHKWGKAAEKYNKLFAKDPNFPGLTVYKTKITFNKNKFLILGGVLLLVALLMIMFFMLKKNKKKKE
jgi:outer membrane protein assembly factor BamB/tetratricopeptide (TPR) repeat protein